MQEIGADYLRAESVLADPAARTRHFDTGGKSSGSFLHVLMTQKSVSHFMIGVGAAD
jgi:hypothetical protein